MISSWAHRGVSIAAMLRIYHYDLKVRVAQFDNSYNAQEGNHNVQSFLDKTGWDYECRAMNIEESLTSSLRI